MEMDSLNLLVKVIDLEKGAVGSEMVITRSTIKKIVSTAVANAENVNWKMAKPY